MMSRLDGRSGIWRTLCLLGDLGIALAAFATALLIRIHLPVPFTQTLLPPDRLKYLGSEAVVILLAQLLALYFFGFYDPPEPRVRGEGGRRLLAATSLQGLGLMGYYFLTNRAFPRSVLLLFVLVNSLLLFGWRSLLLRLYRIERRRVVIVGGGGAAQEVARAIRTHHWHGLEVAGFVPAPDETLDETPDRAEWNPALGASLGTVEELPALLARGEVDDIILAANGSSWQSRLIDLLAASRPGRSNVLLLPGPFESLIGRMRYRWVHDLPLIEVVRSSEWRINWPLKRLLDLTLGSLLLVLSLPVMAACAGAVRLTSPGPILYRQARIGRGQRPFTLWKFRTMQVDAEKETGEILAKTNDPRLTPIGAFLRRFRLDELPQLFNVLQGTMSLVGPRPERPGFVERYLKEVPGYAERFSLAPGLTGLAQVNGEYHSSPQNKLRYDLAYMANWSLWLDLSILLRTVKIILTSRGT